MLPTSSRPGRESYGRNDVRAKKNTPRCCACVKSPRTKNEPHRVTRCKSRSPDLGNRIPMISRRKNSPALPTSAPSTRPPSRPVPPSSGHTTRRRKSSATPSKARTHIFVHDGLSSGATTARSPGSREPKDVAAGRGRQDARLGNGGGQKSAAWCFYGGAFRRSPFGEPRGDCPGTFSRSMVDETPGRHLRL